ATVKATLKCHSMIVEGVLPQDDAVAALNYCLHERKGKPIDFDAALKEMDWTREGGFAGEMLEIEQPGMEEAVQKSAAEIQSFEPAHTAESIDAPPFEKIPVEYAGPQSEETPAAQSKWGDLDAIGAPKPAAAEAKIAQDVTGTRWNELSAIPTPK